MFCRNCGFKTEDQELTECPECGCILSRTSPDDIEDPEADEFFEDIDNILSSETAEPDSEEQPEPEPEDDAAEQTDRDLDTDEDEPQTASKAVPILLLVFLLMITAGAGVFYLKSKQPDAVPMAKTETAKPKDEILKSLLKQKGSSPAEEKNQPQSEPAAVSEIAVPVEPEPARPRETVQDIQKAAPETPPPAPAEKTSIEQEPSKSEAKTNAPAVEVKQPAPKATKAQPAKVISKPELKKGFWTVYKPGGKTFFTLQISSMATRTFAKAHLDRLKKKGHPAYVILTRNREGQTVYKLRVGQYRSESEARKAADTFYQKERMQSIIVKSNADINL